MAVNATGAFLGSKHAIPEMKKSGGGSIVNMSSGAGIVGNADGTAYGPSKGAVKILTKTTAHQYAMDGIRANSIHPGPIDTPMLHAQTREAAEKGDAVANIPMGAHRDSGGDSIRGAVPGLGRVVLCHGNRASDRRGSGERVVARPETRYYNR